jgi:hypothetical protein
MVSGLRFTARRGETLVSCVTRDQVGDGLPPEGNGVAGPILNVSQELGKLGLGIVGSDLDGHLHHLQTIRLVGLSCRMVH